MHPNQIHSSWTEPRVALLRRLWAAGLSASQIANELRGVTRNAVIGKVHRLGLAGRATPNRPCKRPPRPRRLFGPRPPRQIVKPEPEPEPAPEPVVSLNVPLMKLRDHHCHAVTDNADWGRPLYCGHPVTLGSCWCAAHARRFYSRRKRARKPVQHENSIGRLQQIRDGWAAHL